MQLYQLLQFMVISDSVSNALCLQSLKERYMPAYQCSLDMLKVRGAGECRRHMVLGARSLAFRSCVAHLCRPQRSIRAETRPGDVPVTPTSVLDVLISRREARLESFGERARERERKRL